MRYFILISILLINNCGAPQKSEMTAQDKVTYLDSAHALITYILAKDSLIAWPVISNMRTGKYEYLDSSQRFISNSYLMLKPHFTIEAIRKVDYQHMVLNPQDTGYMQYIIQNMAGVKIEKSLAGVQLIPFDSIASNPELMRNYISFSLPLFTPDFEIAILEINYNCRPDCGHGDQLILKKVNQQWTLLQRNMSWIN